MSLVSRIFSLGVTALKNRGFNNAATKIVRAKDLTKRAVKIYPNFVFGTGTESASQAMLHTKGDIFTKARAGWHAAEKNAARAAAKGGFFKNMWKNFWNPTIYKGAKQGLAAAKGKGFLAGAKGLFKGAASGFAKKLPLIGSIIMVACEIPNIVTATKEKGLWQGVKETGKAAARLGGGAAGAAAGAAIGTAICPGIGTAIGGLIGWIAGERVTTKIVGKSYTEKKAEKQQAVAEYLQETQQAAQAQVQTPQQAMGTQTAFAPQSNPFAQTPYGTNPFGATNNILHEDIFARQYFGS